MSKRAGKRKRKSGATKAAFSALIWWGAEGLHVVSAGAPPSPEELVAMSRTFQEKLRHSPLWAQLVAQVGPERAEQLLLHCRVEVRPGGHAHGGTPSDTRPDL